MNNLIFKKVSNRLKQYLPVIFLFGTAAFSKVSAQCKYVTTSAEGAITEINLPAGFPVYHYLENPGIAGPEFEKALATFRSAHPELSHVQFKPAEFPGNPGTYIEIPANLLETFNSRDQQSIRFMTTFYKITSSK